MSQDPRRIAFIKTLVAAAWADGSLNAGEIRTLTEYLERFEITDEEYEQLRPLIDEPVAAESAERLLRQQLESLRTPQERSALVAAVEDLLLVNDELTEEERTFLAQLRRLVEEVSTPELLVGRLHEIWSTVERPSRPPRSGRPAELAERFLEQRLLAYFRRQLAVARARQGGDLADDVPDADLYRVVIWAALLAAVAHADDDFCPAERDQLRALLAGQGDLARGDVEVVIDAFRGGGVDQINVAPLVREFRRLASPEEAERLLDCLFLVAAADGEVDADEVRVIREIAARAGFSGEALQSAADRSRRRLEQGWN